MQFQAECGTEYGLQIVTLFFLNSPDKEIQQILTKLLTASCKNTKASSPISYQEGSSMTAVRKRQAYAKRYAKGLPWKWTGEKNNSLSTPSQ